MENWKIFLTMLIMSMSVRVIALIIVQISTSQREIKEEE